MTTQTGPTQRPEDARTPGTLQVSKEVHFHSAHHLRVCNQTPACTRIHGHTYKLKATWEIRSCPDHLDEEGMVTNFAFLKGMLQKISELFDHHLVNSIELPELKRLGKCSFDPDKVADLDPGPATHDPCHCNLGGTFRYGPDENCTCMGAGWKLKPSEIMPTQLETTAEMMVWWIGEYLLDLTEATRSQIIFKEATLWETPTSSATWRPAVS